SASSSIEELSPPKPAASFLIHKRRRRDCAPWNHLTLPQEPEMHTDFQFVDRTGAAATAPNLIPAVIIPKEAIEAEVDRLAALPPPENGRRISAIVNPM